MAHTNNIENLYVIARAGQQTMAVQVRWVKEMVPMPPVTEVPRVPETVRGVINLRGKVMALVDLRLCLGMLTCHQESSSLVEMMDAREQDHVNWMQELEASVREEREFTLARDPHKCAFGKWYYAYNAQNSAARCMALDRVLVKFEDPHNRVHALADKVSATLEHKGSEAALELIENARANVLQEMHTLFDQARRTIRETERELVMILSGADSDVAVSVDAVESVEILDQESTTRTDDLGLKQEDALVAGVGRRRHDDSLLLILDVSDILAAGNQVQAMRVN